MSFDNFIVRPKRQLVEKYQKIEMWLQLNNDHLAELEQHIAMLPTEAEPLSPDEQESTAIVYTNFQDKLIEVRENSGVYVVSGSNELELYRKRVEFYIKDNQNNLTIQRIKRNLSITRLDLEELENKLFDASGIGDLAQYQSTIHPDKSLGVFIRELVGLDRGAAKDAFATYLDESKFNSQQIRFVNTIIDYLTQNGVMSPSMLAQAPFTDIHFEGVFGLFDDPVAIDLRDTIKRVEAMAVGE